MFSRYNLRASKEIANQLDHSNQAAIAAELSVTIRAL